MHSLWLVLLLLVGAPTDESGGAWSAYVLGSSGSAHTAAEQESFPAGGVRTLLAPLQLTDNSGGRDHPADTHPPHGGRVQLGAIHRSDPQTDPNCLPPRICERLTYDATAPPTFG
ncbi:MAG: hypothetical protein WD737_12830 [Gemmatimonadota bacterium]